MKAELTLDDGTLLSIMTLGQFVFIPITNAKDMARHYWTILLKKLPVLALGRFALKSKIPPDTFFIDKILYLQRLSE